MLPKNIKETPWDNIPLNLKTFELNSFNKEASDFILRTKGHYSLKVNPSSSKEEIVQFGFYYCDTLVQPFCQASHFISFEHENIYIKLADSFDSLVPIANNVWDYGRFHRDFNITKSNADNRYLQWLKQLFVEDSVYYFMFKNEIAGFVACKDNSLVLHALDKKYRGKGLGKYFWTKICKHLFSNDYEEITSSISMANIIVLNLYSSLGFKFRNPQDVYHYLQT